MEIHLEIAKHDKKRLNPIFATINIRYIRRSFVNNIRDPYYEITPMGLPLCGEFVCYNEDGSSVDLIPFQFMFLYLTIEGTNEGSLLVTCRPFRIRVKSVKVWGTHQTISGGLKSYEEFHPGDI